MKRIKFNKPGKYIANDQRTTIEVVDADQEFEVVDSFYDFQQDNCILVEDSSSASQGTTLEEAGIEPSTDPVPTKRKRRSRKSSSKNETDVTE